MNYQNMTNNIYIKEIYESYIQRNGIDLFGKESTGFIEIIKELRDIFPSEVFENIEHMVIKAFNENNYNGFYAGFRYAASLLCGIGKKTEPPDITEDGELNIVVLPSPLKEYARLIGIDNLLKLAEVSGGKQIYIPKKDCILKHFVIEKIRNEYNGRNIKELAGKYCVAERTVYNYINK